MSKKPKQKANHFKSTKQKFLASINRTDNSTGEEMSRKKNKATSPAVPNRGKDTLKIQARNLGQKHILKSLNENLITIVDAPAGCGKSHLAILYGLNQLLKGTYQKLIIARPCVQSYGQNLGFLPGSAEQKVLVYFQHLFDILQKQVDISLIKKAIADRRIMIVPFAFMRGKNFENAFVFCDEVQTTIPEQFRLIITRLSQGSKMILCGDSRQSDRCDQLGNGLADAIRKFKIVDDIGIVSLGAEYIVRSKIVKTIEQIYDHDSAIKKGNNEPVNTDLPKFAKNENKIKKEADKDIDTDEQIPSRDTLWT